MNAPINPSHASAQIRHLLTCGQDTLVKVFDADNFSAEPRTIDHHESPVTSIAVDRKAPSPSPSP